MESMEKNHHSLAQQGKGPHTQLVPFCRRQGCNGQRRSCFNMSLFKPQKPLLHSFPFGEVLIVTDPLHSDMLRRLHWQLALEEKAPAQALVNTLVFYYSGNLGKNDPILLFGSFSTRVSETQHHLKF